MCCSTIMLQLFQALFVYVTCYLISPDTLYCVLNATSLCAYFPEKNQVLRERRPTWLAWLQSPHP